VFTRAEALRRLVGARASALPRLSALRTNLWLQGRWGTVDSIEAVVRQRLPADPINEGWDQVRARMAGDTALYRRLLESAVAKGDAKDPVQTANRQMMAALEEGRLRDADRFREASIATYRARGVPIEPFIEAGMSLSSAIEAGADSPSRIRAYEEAIRAAPPASRMRASLSAASHYARLGRTVRARAMLAAFDSLATDSTSREQYAESREEVLGELAFAEGRWAEAVALARRKDQLPDGPATSCVHCLPLELMELFAAAGQTDSLLAQHAAYLRTPMGARPLRGPDFTVPIRSLWALARAYDARGDRVNAVAAYQAYVARFGRADPELQGKVADARERVRALGVGGR
jgi:tetratricopeptide (TPR) repeat protein